MIMEQQTDAITSSYTFLGRRYSSASLKGLAILFMIIDHIGAILLPAINVTGTYDGIYEIMRTLGRLSYPLFVYLLIQGFKHTRSRLHYLMWLLISAVITEPLFDFAHTLTWLEFGDQNVLFTLALALVLLIFLDKVRTLQYSKPVTMLLSFIGIVLTIIIGHITNIEYGEVTPFYLLGLYAYDHDGKKTPIQLFGSMLGIIYISLVVKGAIEHPGLITSVSGICRILSSSLSTQLYAALSVFFIAAYDGTKGHQLNKLFYYAVYPVHLLILGIIKYFI